MKKTIITILSLAVASISIYAQTASDALSLVTDDIEGSARFNAMGGAFTALGGDVSSIALNPAAGAVNSYSTLYFSPSVFMNKTLAGGTDSGLGFNDSPLCEHSNDWSIGSWGTSLNWKTNRSSGLKRMSFAFLMNRNDISNVDWYASGVNDKTSFAGYLATSCNGISVADLRSQNVWSDSNVSYPGIVGWNSCVFDPIIDDNSCNEYVGVTENLEFDSNGKANIYLGGPLDQSFSRYRSGYSKNYIFSLSGNISDKFFLGANIGIVNINYNLVDVYKEEAIDRNQFETGFSDLSWEYNNHVNADGAYGQFGFIYVPFSWLRLGASAQTPMLLDIGEEWIWYSDVRRLKDGKDYKYSSQSQLCDDHYNITTPMKVNAGFALVVGKVAILSFDWGLTDYSTMYYSAVDSGDKSSFRGVNSEIRDYLGQSQTYRIGIEVKPVPNIALRAGYISKESPEYYYNPNSFPQKHHNSAVQEEYSFGIGYDSGNSFFADACLRTRNYMNSYYMPYGDYMPNVLSPEICLERTLSTLSFTFGWKF